MISRKLVRFLSAAAVLGGLSLSPAAAMPVGGLAASAEALPAQSETVRWVCGPYRCWWRPRPYVVRPYYARPYYGFYGPRPWRPYRYGFYGPRRWW